MTAHDTPVEGTESPFEAVVDELPSTSGGEGAASSSDTTGFLNTSLTRRFKGKIQPLSMPSYEQMMQEDVMNNCAVKSAIAGVMGGLLGVAFGIFTASLDTGVRRWSLCRRRRAHRARCVFGGMCCLDGLALGCSAAWAARGRCCSMMMMLRAQKRAFGPRRRRGRASLKGWAVVASAADMHASIGR